MGFTLVEMLIVVAIVGLVASLVAPFSARVLERAKAQQEWLTAQRVVDRLAIEAFLSGRPITVTADGAALAWFIHGVSHGEQRYDYIFFDPGQRVVINESGFADAEQITLHENKQQRHLDLNFWVGSNQ